MEDPFSLQPSGIYIIYVQYFIMIRRLIDKIEPIDIIAVVVLCMGFALKLHGADGYVSFSMTSVVFYYFGKKGQILNK